LPDDETPVLSSVHAQSEGIKSEHNVSTCIAASNAQGFEVVECPSRAALLVFLPNFSADISLADDTHTPPPFEFPPTPEYALPPFPPLFVHQY